MRERKYIKKKSQQEPHENQVEPVLDQTVLEPHSRNGKKIAVCVGVLLFAAFSTLITAFIHKTVSDITISEDDTGFFSAPTVAAASASRSVIVVPAGMTKANPFVPYRDIDGLLEAERKNKIVDDLPAYTLVEPPEVVDENSDAARLMDTIVSGILYDKYSPSAILNIEGTDYLVKKGDVVNNYKVVNIMQDSVTVKLGSNVYKAGIGEILTEGVINRNEVSNLNKKFGGEK